MNARHGGPTEPAQTPNDAGRIDDVVRRAQHGEVQAFESLYRAHAAMMYALCRRMTGDDQVARELVQDVFVRAWQRLPSFQGHSSLGTWLHSLAVNVVLEHLRSATRDGVRFVDDGNDMLLPARASQPDLRIDIDRAVARLPLGARTVFVLHDIEGYSHDEIAHMTGIAAGTARAQLFRARRALMRWLGP